VQLAAIAVAVATAGDAGNASFSTTFDSSTGTTTTTTTSTGSITAQLIVSVLGTFATLIATAASVKAISDAWVGKDPYWRESLREARKRAFSIIWLVIVSGVLLLLALFALIIPAIWLAVPCALAFPALMVEGSKGFKAIGRGRRLVKGRWWATAAEIGLGYMLAGILGFMFGALAGALFLTSGDNAGFAIANAITSSLATVVTTPFNAAIITLAYFDLRTRKEGFDLELLTERIGAPPGEAQPGFFRPEPVRYGGAEPPFWPPPPDWQPPPGWTPSPPQG
jgi:hypothetical protein